MSIINPEPLDAFTVGSAAFAIVDAALVVLAIRGRRPLGRVLRAVGRSWLAILLGSLAGIFCGLVAGPIAMVALYDPLGDPWASRAGVAIAYGLVLVGGVRGYMIGARRSTIHRSWIVDRDPA